QMAKDFLERYVEQAWGMFSKYRQQFEEQFGAREGLAAFFSSLANWNRAMLNPFGMPFMGGGPSNQETNKPTPRDEAEKSDLQDKVSTLQQQIARLEEKLAKKEGAAKKRSKSPKKRVKQSKNPGK
ncbi:MAG TPA: hypothetical protein VFB72_15320, partial [Verrucomicrobiae bacterium]|nr:hypothetical protein [Verrucomicrobiae bacterium]